MRHRSPVVLALTATSALAVSQAMAQDAKIPVKKLGAAEARTAEPVGSINGLRALSDGTVLLNDFQQRRLVMFDAGLKQVKIVADTLGTGLPYGQRMPALMPYQGDSSIIADPATLSLVVLNKQGEVARVMSAPRPQDINSLASATFGTTAFDSRGQLIYRAQGGPGMGGGNVAFGGGGGGGGGGRGGDQGGGGRGGQQGGGGRGGQQGGGGRGGFGGDDFGGGFPGGGNGPGGNNGPNGGRGGRGNQAQPDSVPILRSNFDTRKTDTVTFVRVPKNEFATTPTPEGGTRVITKINPLPQADDWALLSDGTVAVVRVLDYHVDWYTPDGKKAASEKLPFDWKALGDSDKVKIVDSLKAAAEIYTRQAQGLTQGNNQFRIAFEPVAAEKLPDYYPPIRQGSTHADADGNLWILPATSSISANDFLAAAAGGGRGGGGRGPGGGGDNGGRGGAGGPPGGNNAGGNAGAGGDRGGNNAGGNNAGGNAAGGDRGGRGGRTGGAPGAGLESLIPQGPVVSLNYDVVNRKGELVERVQLPPGRNLAGFGPNGVMYLSVREGRNLFIEKYKRP